MSRAPLPGLEDLAGTIRRLIREHGLDVVQTEIAKHEKNGKRPGREKEWDDQALIVTFLEVEVERRLRPKMGTLQVCKHLLREGPFIPTAGRAKVDLEDAAGTLKRRYQEAKKFMERLPQPVQERYARMIQNASERRRQRTVRK